MFSLQNFEFNDISETSEDSFLSIFPCCLHIVLDILIKFYIDESKAYWSFKAETISIYFNI